MVMLQLVVRVSSVAQCSSRQVQYLQVSLPTKLSPPPRLIIIFPTNQQTAAPQYVALLFLSHSAQLKLLPVLGPTSHNDITIFSAPTKQTLIVYNRLLFGWSHNNIATFHHQYSNFYHSPMIINDDIKQISACIYLLAFVFFSFHVILYVSSSLPSQPK